MTDRGITADVLFVGATRPPMRWGVTYAALMFNMVFTLEAFLVTKNLLALLLCVPIHGICALLCLQDPRYFDLLLLWSMTRLPAWIRGVRTWRASGYGPLIIDLPNGRAKRRRRPVSVVAGSVAGGRRAC